MSDDGPSRSRTPALALGALGVVYGDIGTSPLYALKECFHNEARPDHALPLAGAAGEANVLGVLSLVFWSLVLVVGLKYLVFIMRADNRGEGGIFALLALLTGTGERFSGVVRSAAVLAALLGAGLLYGDGVITPAVSVLSAVEGIEQATHAADHFVVPITCVILAALFLAQKAGTGGIGRVFGPIMMAWFATIGVLGAVALVKHPAVLVALNPWHAVTFFAENGFHGFIVLGAVVLCITGGEALYADMGHFGRNPIRLCWFAVVLPCLLLSYFGQGAMLLVERETAARSPFYNLVPHVLLYPMVALATVATVIASQALISGAFSLTRQAMQLGYCPRMTVVHTSGRTEGQIFLPEVNMAMMIACIGLVVTFKSSSALASAYGLAVTAVMAITSALFYLVATRAWGWAWWKALPPVVLFLVVDLAYFGSNLVKFADGGWFPAVIGLAVLVAMYTWRQGRTQLARKLTGSALPIGLLMDDVGRRALHRVPGTAVFMSSNVDIAPPAMLHHLKHNRVLHETVLLLAIHSANVPHVADKERLTHEELRAGFHRVIARYGFMETPDVPAVLRRLAAFGLTVDPAQASYFLSRETLIVRGKSNMSRLRRLLFSFMSRNALPATAYFGLPPGRVIELGIQVEI